jgi:hypothetical protein
MFFIFGSRLMGKVDQVPGYFHVATKFGHLNYLPLIPMQSYIVISHQGKSFRGVPIPLNWKSVAVAWARSVCGLMAVIGAIIAAYLLAVHARMDELAPAAVATALGVVGFALTKWHRSVTHANVDRACMLARMAGIGERGIAQIRNSYAQGFEVVQPGAPADIPIAQVAAPASMPISTPASMPFPDFSAPAVPAPAPQRTFFVTGRNRKTGEDACITVHATNETTARAGGESRDLDVRLVEPGGSV